MGKSGAWVPGKGQGPEVVDRVSVFSVQEVFVL